MKKRFLKVFLPIVVLCLLLSVTACSNKNDEPEKNTTCDNITVMSDIHILSSEQYGDTITPGLRRLLTSNEKAIGLTEAIFRTAIDDFIASDSPILILTGDLADDGAETAHRFVAGQLARAEAAGKRCFVVNGNHDINNHATSYVNDTPEDVANVTPEKFAEIYAQFGFSESLVRDENSLSYTADLTDKYRLIAFDCAKYDLDPGTDRSVTKRHDPHVTQSLLDWLTAQLEKCEEDHKEPFLISHFPILSHIGPLVGSASHVNMQDKTLEVLSNGHVAFSFCGHVHQQDIASYSNGSKVYYEIETGSLSYTNLPIRHFTDDGTTIRITTTQQKYVKEEYIPSFYSAEEKALILTDLPTYVWYFESGNFSNYMFGKLYMDDILEIFGITDEESIERAQAVVNDFYYMPLYEKEGYDGITLETICKKYGINDLPKVGDAQTVGQMLASLIRSNFAGDEKTTIDSPVVKQFTYAVFAAADRLSETKILSDLGLIEENSAEEKALNLTGLFTTGKIEIVKSGVLGIVTKIPALKNNSAMKSLGISTGTPREIAQSAKGLLKSDVVLNLFGDGKISLAVKAFYDEKTGFGKVLDLSKLESEGVGYLDLNGLIDGVINGIGVGLLTDDGAPDNFFEFPSPSYNAE